MKQVLVNTPHHAIIEEELRLLARVSAVLSEISSQTIGAPDFNSALINLRDQIAEAKPEDIGPLVEQMTRISAIAQRYGKGRDLPINPSSPYFAHMKLEEGETIRDVLIGKRGFIDRQRKVQIVDWRNAPVSRLYYRYEEGDDYEEPVGDLTLEGVIQARRNLTITESKLCRIGCPQGTFVADQKGAWHEAESVDCSELKGGQGAAARPPAIQHQRQNRRQLGVHSGPIFRADKHLPEIAALIDPTQFDLIIKPGSGLVVLQGGAGSGKTTVALHRVAYLNFNLPGRFRSDQILVVVPSIAMVRYVERVLPSLGVRGVRVITARRWFERTRNKVLPSAPRVYNDDTPSVVLRFKKHPFLLQLMKQYVADQLSTMEQDLAQAMRGSPDGDKVIERWNELASEPPNRRMTRLRDWLRQQPLTGLITQRAQTVTKLMLRRLRDIVADWAEILTDRTLLSLGVERYCPGTFSGRDLEQVCQWCSKQSDEVPEIEPKHNTSRRDRKKKKQDNQQDDNPYISLDGRDERDVPVAGKLDIPDDSLLLYLFQLKYGKLFSPSGKTIRYEHLVIDEAQDLSASEIKVFIECTTRFRSITLAGDVAQRLVFDNAFTTWENLLGQIGVKAATNNTLSLGYRSTEQIMELARHLVGDTKKFGEWKATRRGAHVELHCFDHQGEAVAMMGDALRSLSMREPLASVACIARYPEQARSFAAALAHAEVPNVRLVANQEFSFRPGIEVTDVSQVKGLEFDYVILLDVTSTTYPDTVESRNMLYIGATRAAHQLWLLASGQPSPLLPAELC